MWEFLLVSLTYLYYGTAHLFAFWPLFINSYMTTLDITMSGKIKVPEGFDLVKTNGNNRLIFKLNVYH